MDENIQLRLVKNENDIQNLSVIVSDLAKSVGATNRSIENLSKQHYESTDQLSRKQDDNHRDLLKLLNQLELKNVQSKAVSWPLIFTIIGTTIAILASLSSALVMYISLSINPIRQDVLDNKSDIQKIEKSIEQIKDSIYTHTHK